MLQGPNIASHDDLALQRYVGLDFLKFLTQKTLIVYLKTNSDIHTKHISLGRKLARQSRSWQFTGRMHNTVAERWTTAPSSSRYRPQKRMRRCIAFRILGRATSMALLSCSSGMSARSYSESTAQHQHKSREEPREMNRVSKPRHV